MYARSTYSSISPPSSAILCEAQIFSYIVFAAMSFLLDQAEIREDRPVFRIFGIEQLSRARAVEIVRFPIVFAQRLLPDIARHRPAYRVVPERDRLSRHV